jgi:hypothetical protein
MFEDYQNLNHIPIGDSFSLPLITDLLDSLGQAIFFSTLDCTVGYYQIPLNPDQPKTAFSTPKGYIRFDAFLASEYNEAFSGYQLGKVVQFCRKQCFEDHLCPRPHIHSTILTTRTEMVFKTLVSTKLNHINQLIAQENFIIPKGYFEYKRMYMGLKGLPAKFQRLMNNIMNGIQICVCIDLPR